MIDEMAQEPWEGPGVGVTTYYSQHLKKWVVKMATQGRIVIIPCKDEVEAKNLVRTLWGKNIVFWWLD